jgi:hypothetical protein
MAKSYAKPPEMTIDPTKTYTATIDTTLGYSSSEICPSVVSIVAV